MQDRERASSRRLGCHFWTPSSLRWNHKVSLFSLQSPFFFFVNVCHTASVYSIHDFGYNFLWNCVLKTKFHNLSEIVFKWCGSVTQRHRAHTGIINNDIFFSSSSFIFILFLSDVHCLLVFTMSFVYDFVPCMLKWTWSFSFFEGCTSLIHAHMHSVCGSSGTIRLFSSLFVLFVLIS